MVLSIAKKDRNMVRECVCKSDERMIGEMVITVSVIYETRE